MKNGNKSNNYNIIWNLGFISNNPHNYNNKKTNGGKKMVFRKNKKEEIVEQPTEVVKTNTGKQEEEVLTPEQEKVKEMINWYNEKYNGIISTSDTTHIYSLSFGILQELRKTNELLKELNKE